MFRGTVRERREEGFCLYSIALFEDDGADCQ